MARNITFERIKTYLFGFAIGSVLVAIIFLAKADQNRRQLAEAEARAAAAAQTSKLPPQ